MASCHFCGEKGRDDDDDDEEEEEEECISEERSHIPSLHSAAGKELRLCCCHSPAEFIRLQPPFCRDASFLAQSPAFQPFPSPCRRFIFSVTAFLTRSDSSSQLFNIPLSHYSPGKVQELFT